MALASWFEGDSLPYLPRVEGLSVGVAEDDGELAVLNGVTDDIVAARRRLGNIPYIARFFGRPVAYGWVATDLAHIGEVGLSFRLTPSERYLWDFHTLPFCRASGIYQRLLQAIVLHEDATQFWLNHTPENLPPGVGIGRTGFTEVGILALRANGTPGLHPTGPVERFSAASDLLGVPLVETEMSENAGVEETEGDGRICGPGLDTESAATGQREARLPVYA
jgi:hypothetical protein